MDQIAMTIGYGVLICGLGALIFGVLSFVAYLILLAWEAFSYDGNKLAQGRDAAKNVLRDNPDLADEIEGKIMEALKK